MDFQPFIDRYEKELFDEVIPFWEEHCVDKEFGGYFTFLDRDGSVYDTEKYMWMQWRIVYMFATFYSSARREERWLDIARQGYDFLTAHGKSEDGTYYFALNRAGEATMAPSNIFSECFAAMGAAALFKATGEEKVQNRGQQRHEEIHCPHGQSEGALGEGHARQAPASFPWSFHDAGQPGRRHEGRPWHG